MLDKRLGIYIDKSSSRSAWNMPTVHSHKSHELYFLVSGRRRYFVGHSVYEIRPGNLIFIPKGMLHRTTTPDRAGYERYVVNFFENYLQDFIELTGRTTFDCLLHSGCLELPTNVSRHIQQNLTQMDQELTNRVAYTDATVIHLLQDILLNALRYGKPAMPCTGETADKIQHVARYISENYAEVLSLHDAAQMANMEDTYFSKRFKTLTGFGFHEYLTQTRLLAAQHLLEETSVSVSEIADRCGFSSSNYFGDVFRRWKGCSPSQHRTSFKEKPLI